MKTNFLKYQNHKTYSLMLSLPTAKKKDSQKTYNQQLKH
jgi:hypothetical protein